MIFSWILWLIIIFYLIYKYYTWNYDYWYKRGVPYLPGSAPFGNITDIFFNRKIIGELYKEIYEKFEGSPWCGFFKMRTPILMIREPELIKQVLVKDYYHFEENDFHFNPDADPIMAMNPFTVSGKEWKDTRSILSPAQTPGKIKTVIPCTVTVARNMLDHLNKNHGCTLEMLELFGHYTTDLTASWGLGLEINSFINPNSDIRVNATNMFGGDFRTNMAILLGFYAPTIGNILGWSMMTKGFVNFFNGLVRDVINKRKTSNIKKQDLVEMLLEFQKDSVTKLKRDMDFQEITGHALTFFSEGYLTSSFTLTFIFHELSLNQEVQDKAREEIQREIGSVDDIDYDKLQNLTYVSQIIDETLRLHPTVPNMTRMCTKRTTFKSGGKELIVEPGTPIAIPTWGIHLDPKYYENPNKFDPDRYSDEQRAKRDRILNLGFSDGPRACVGIRFALTNLKICIASILLNFKVLPSDQSHKFTIDHSSSFVMMPKNAFVRFEKL